MSRNYFAGIGSRETPPHILEYIKSSLCPELVKRGLVLRSGGADGADKAFEQGYDKLQAEKQIFLPWKAFNNNKSDMYWVCNQALDIAEKFHPHWDTLSPPAKNLHGRNVYQVLGWGFNYPSKFVICWTPDGAEFKTSRRTGGTGQAIRIANGNNIPVINLQKYDGGLFGTNEIMRFIDMILEK